METNLLEILVCPLCKGKLEYDRVGQELICRFDRLAYPICDGIPVMLASEARTVSQAENKNNKEDNHDD
jgi:uncharacterized protein YbaR (Trm112 family)